MSTVFTAAKASGTLTRAAGTDLLADGDTVTVGDRTYRFKTTTAQADDIFLSGSSEAATDAAFASLVKVVNGTGVLAAAGADGFTGSVKHKSVKAALTTADQITFTALLPGVAGNHIPLSEAITDAQITVSAATLENGTGSAHADLDSFLDGMEDRMQLNSQVIEAIDAIRDGIA